jgi:hypothetical protein
LQVQPQALPLQLGDEFGGPDDGHTLPHPLQLFGSFVSLTHAASVLQYVSPALHDTPHTPATHWGVPFVAPGHLVPQPLQLFGSVCSLTHAPLQSVNPPLQAVPHALLTHVGWEFAPPAGHALPHPSQLAGSSVVLTHVVPLHSVGVLPEHPLAQVVPLHVGVLPEQTMLQPPQLADVVVLVSHP